MGTFWSLLSVIMDFTKDTASGEPKNPQSVTINAEDDPLLALADLFSEASLDGRYVEVPMSRPLSALLPTPQLNDHCCLALFNQFSLQEQLQLRAVCRQWQAIIEKKCRRIRSLKLFRNVDHVKWFCHELVELKLEDDEAEQLKLKPVGHDDDLFCSLDQLHQCAHLFADITSFVYLRLMSNLDLIPLMFPQLTTLTLNTSQSPFTVINSLPLLTSLNLHYLDEDTVIPESMPILRQLEWFSFCNYNGPHIASLLSQLGPNLTRLMLRYVYLSAADLVTAIASNPSLATSVTHLTIGYLNSPFAPYRALLDLICNQFTNLVYLHFYYIHLMWFPSLTKQQHITELHIDILNISDWVPRRLPQVSSVKQLHLTFFPIPTAAVNLQRLFPAVESICMYHQQEDQLERARQYMSQFSITCPVTFHVKKNLKCYMGRH